MYPLRRHHLRHLAAPALALAAGGRGDEAVSEPYTITANGRTWTRATKAGAIALADNIARGGDVAVAVVTLTETGWVEYRAEPVSRKPLTIRVAPRLMDPGRWKAWLEGDSRIWGAGDNPLDAIGSLV